MKIIRKLQGACAAPGASESGVLPMTSTMEQLYEAAGGHGGRSLAASTAAARAAGSATRRTSSTACRRF